MVTKPSLVIGQSWQEYTMFDSVTIIHQHHVDHLANHYVVTPEMHILKFKPDGTFWHRYDNNRLGVIGILDVTNPMKLLVYYPQHQTVITLDNNMAETSKILLTRLGIGYIRGIGLSDDNNIWLWNEADRLLTKINNRGEIIMKGVPSYNFFIDPQTPVFLLQRGNYIVISQEGLPIQVFDLFGKWIRSISDIEDFVKILALGKELTYQTQTGIWRHSMVHTIDADRLILEIQNSANKFSIDPVNGKIYRISNSGKLEFIVL